MTPEQRRMRARLAANSRHHPDRPDLGEHDRRDLKASRLADHIRRIVDDWPPLTDEQRSRLAALLMSSTPDGSRTA